MSKNKIFEKIKIKDTEFSNRIVVSPMCQYSAENGLMNDWHFQHLSQFGFSGVGLVMIESTAVESIGSFVDLEIVEAKPNSLRGNFTGGTIN